MYMGEKYTIVTTDGFLVRVELEPDQDSGPPWEDCDCYGIVDTGRRDKAAGEVILHEEHGYRWFYDFKKSVEKARKGGWGCARPTRTKGERAHYAVMEDMKTLRDWLRGDWEYCVVVVSLLAIPGGFDEDDDANDFTVATDERLGGVEYGMGDNLYIRESVDNMIEELLHPYRKVAA